MSKAVDFKFSQSDFNFRVTTSVPDDDPFLSKKEKETQLKAVFWESDSVETSLDDFNQKQSATLETIKTIDRWTWKISLVLVVVTIFFFLFMNKHDQAVRLMQNTLVISTNKDFINAARLWQVQHDQHFSTHNKPEFTIALQQSHWIKQHHVVASHTVEAKLGVFGAMLPLWPFILWIYSWSFICQWIRSKEHGKLYKPWKGPEFSRWLEYLLTSPVQILVVSMSFQFVVLDTLLGLFGMQAALVLLGYSVEQQIKKTYKRQQKKFEKIEGMHHLLNPLCKDMRLFVYLFVCWLLHVCIWGFPRILPWGVGGLYQRLKDMNAYEDQQMPVWIEAIFWSQFLSFTTFGIVCTTQAVFASSLKSSNAKTEWLKYSKIYSILSVTSKLLLDVTVLGYLRMWQSWTLLPKDTLVCGNIAYGNLKPAFGPACAAV
jgi:hypothetical protein